MSTADARTRYPRLFSPMALGPLRLPHRAVMSAHGMGHGDAVPGVSDRYHAYLVERARGGAAMVGIESSPVHWTTFSRSLVIRLDQESVVPGLARTAAAIHDAGALVAITLWHGGHKDPLARGAYAVAPSAVPNMAGEVPHVLTRRGIRDIVQAYGAAAERCRRAGLDCLEVQTATDYLLGSFLSPALNHRTDEYGGSLENRTRIVREILATVREAAGPGMAVGVRTSVRHAIPGATEDYTLDEAVAAMARLDAEDLVDYVSVMAGSAWAEGVSIPAMHLPRAGLAEDAARFRAALKVPVVVAGRIRTPAEAEALLAAGQADVIAMARTWIAEPDWALKILDGREAEIRPCISCNQGCAGAVFSGVPGSYVLNPRAGRELQLPPLAPTPAGRTVAVVGGGPAGLETARLAAERGYRVTLHEASGELGGQWRLAGSAPRRAEALLALDWWRAELGRLGVTVRLHSLVSPESPPVADHVVWATGGVPAQTAVWRLRPYLRGGIPGSERAVHGRDVLAGRAEARGSVALVAEEGGWPALSMLEALAARPDVTAVTVLTPEARFAEAQLAVTFETTSLHAALARMPRGRVRVETKSIVETIDADGFLTLREGRKAGPFDTVVLATGTAAAACPEDATAAGDCVAPRGIGSATLDAQRVVRALDA